MKNIATKTDGTSSLPAASFNSIADELENTVTDSGQTLDAGAENVADPSPVQVSTAIARAARAADFFVDSGSANAYSIAKVGDWRAETAYRDGARFRFLASASNTTASTLNVQGLGAKAIRFHDNSALAANAIREDELIEVYYDLAADNFKLAPKKMNPYFFGAATLGTPVANNGTGAAHKIFGGLNAAATGTSANQKRLNINCNTYDSNSDFIAREGTGTIGGACFSLYAPGSDGNPGFYWFVNRVADSNTTASTAVGQATLAGAWTLGASSGTNSAHTIQAQPTGDYALKIVNSNPTNGQSSGVRINAGAGSSDSSLVVANYDNSINLFSVNGAGLGILGTTAVDGVHQIQSAPSASAVLLVNNVAASVSANSRGIDVSFSGDPNCTGGRFIACKNSSGTVIAYCDATSNTTATWTDVSDKRIKQDFRDFDGLGMVMQMEASDYEVIGTGGYRQKGFPAQDLYNICPEVVTVGSDAVNENGDLTDPWGIAYGRLTPILAKAIKQQQALIDSLLKRIEALES